MRRRGTVTGAVVALIAGFGMTAAAQSVDVTRLGPQVGERIPAFSLQDQRGARQDLTSLRGANGLMLVFFRSADW